MGERPSCDVEGCTGPDSVQLICEAEREVERRLFRELRAA